MVATKTINDVDPKEYKEIFTSICRLINSTKKNAMTQIYLEDILSKNHNDEIVFECYADLKEKGYLETYLNKNYSTYVYLTEKAYNKLDKMNIKLKPRG